MQEFQAYLAKESPFERKFFDPQQVLKALGIALVPRLLGGRSRHMVESWRDAWLPQGPMWRRIEASPLLLLNIFS